MSVSYDTPPGRRRGLRTKGRDAGRKQSGTTDILRERSELAAQKMCALGEMTGGIAHDFRNILAIVACGLRMAERSLDDRAGLDSALAAIQDGIVRGNRMTARLLSFASQQELATSPEDVNALLRKLEPFLKYATDSGFRIELALAANLPACLVDPPRFNAAILNLVLNARDAMPQGGAIRIGTAPVQVMDFGRACGFVRVRVRDHGTGMSSEILDRIFDPYFTTKGERGTGLGVPQVHALMDQVGGFVRVDSKVGQGTSFDLFFPIHDDAAEAKADTWRQLDRWADEGGAIAELPAPPSRQACRLREQDHVGE